MLTNIMNFYSKYQFLSFIIFPLILLIIFLIIFKFAYNSYNKNMIDLLTYKSIHSYLPTLNSIVDNDNFNNYKLSDFFIKTAYNCCCTSNFKNSYVNLGSLEICLKQGVRCLDFEIHSVDNNPVVAASSVSDYNKKETYNYLYIKDVLNTIAKMAFSPSICSNFNDPLILHFRIMNNNATMYKNFANIISQTQQFNSLLLGKKYSHEYNGNNLATIPIINFKKKIIIIIYGADTFYQSTQLDEYINIASGQAFMHLLRYNNIKYNNNNNLIEFNKKNMSIVLPNPQINIENPNFNRCREYGCQFIAMSFQKNDSNLKQYNLFFNNNKSAFVLKPQQIR